MQKWEYFVAQLNVPGRNWGDNEAVRVKCQTTLTSWGKQGWELVNFTKGDTEFEAVFVLKRPIS
jgi:hypothetical protein